MYNEPCWELWRFSVQFSCTHTLVHVFREHSCSTRGWILAVCKTFSSIVPEADECLESLWPIRLSKPPGLGQSTVGSMSNSFPLLNWQIIETFHSCCIVLVRKAKVQVRILRRLRSSFNGKRRAKNYKNYYCKNYYDSFFFLLSKIRQ